MTTTVAMQFTPNDDAIKALRKRIDVVNNLIAAEETNIESNEIYNSIARTRIENCQRELNNLLRGIEYLEKPQVSVSS